jgi:hypothetical protein
MTKASPRERLLAAAALVRGVMAELDLTLVDCGCPEHTRHYRDRAQALSHEQLEAAADRISRVAYGEAISHLSGSEPGRVGPAGTSQDAPGTGGWDVAGPAGTHQGRTRTHQDAPRDAPGEHALS